MNLRADYNPMSAMNIVYTPIFIRQYKCLPTDLKEEVHEKIERFKKNPLDRSLKVHKLKGRLKGYWSFSVNYRFRIVFQLDDKKTAALLRVGDHDIYR